MARRISSLYQEPQMPRLWDRGVLVVTVAAIGLLVFDMSLTVDDPRASYVAWADTVLCAILLIDFGLRFRKANDRKRFLKRNWTDLVGSIPLVGPLRAARLVRVVRILRVTRVGALLLRLAKRYELPVATRALGSLLVVSLIIWVLAAFLFYEFELGANEGIGGIDDALWWSITTLSTVGYGDLYPETTGGRVVAIATMVLGVGVLGTLAATIATAFIEMREAGRRGLRRYVMKDHVLVLGWNERSMVAIEELRLDARYQDTPIVILADLEETPVEAEGVRFVRGRPTRSDSLERASADDAAAVLAFASNPSDPRSDHETALAVHAFRRMNDRAYVSAELVDPQNHVHFEAVGCSSVIDVNGIASSLLVRAVMDWGTSDIIRELLTSKEGSELYRVRATDLDLVGRTYRDSVLSLMERGGTIVALVTKGQIDLHPAPDVTLVEGDEVFVLSELPPC